MPKNAKLEKRTEEIVLAAKLIGEMFKEFEGKPDPAKVKEAMKKCISKFPETGTDEVAILADAMMVGVMQYETKVDPTFREKMNVQFFPVMFDKERYQAFIMALNAAHQDTGLTIAMHKAGILDAFGSLSSEVGDKGHEHDWCPDPTCEWKKSA